MNGPADAVKSSGINYAYLGGHFFSGYGLGEQFRQAVGVNRINFVSGASGNSPIHSGGAGQCAGLEIAF